jgi:3-hydroxybutyryl-CoA dehydrogenase
MARITFSVDIEAASSDAEVIIEAVPEVLELKQEVLTAAIQFASPSALIGTNTSQLSITRIAAGLGDAAPRVIGVHFFNPPVMMQLVELVCGLQTADESLERAREFATGIGKEVVVCRKDSPGFLTSRAYAILRLECVRMVEEGLASPADIDKAFRLGFNFPMGPLELGDFNGLDTFVHVLDSLSGAYGERFRPTPSLRNMIAAGHLGRKTGEGFYRYDESGKPTG